MSSGQSASSHGELARDLAAHLQHPDAERLMASLTAGLNMLATLMEDRIAAGPPFEQAGRFDAVARRFGQGACGGQPGNPDLSGRRIVPGGASGRTFAARE